VLTVCREARRLKRKRQERDAKFKEQAQIRKQVGEAEAKAAVAVVKQETEKAPAGEEEGPEKNGGGPAAETSSMPVRARIKAAVPDVLAPEFLESDDDDDDAYQGDLSSVGGEPRRKRRKSKHMGDRVIGSTVYRVVKTSDGRLPPKKSKIVHNERIARVTKGRVPVRRSGGFFVKQRP
jgi:U3 small nucleolar RNA-associated protein 16